MKFYIKISLRDIFYTGEYRIVQRFRGTKLSQLDHHVSIRGKNFRVCIKKRPLLSPQVL